jgi:hypothetical protein
MGQQSVREAARKTVLDVRAARREARAQRERGLDTLAVELHVALGERDAAVAAFERRAGQALQARTSGLVATRDIKGLAFLHDCHERPSTRARSAGPRRPAADFRWCQYG